MGDLTSTAYPPPDVVLSHHPPSQTSTPHRTPQAFLYPPPDITNPAFSPRTQNQTPRRAEPPPPSLPTPAFLIIGLFALRLTQRMLASLSDYPHRAADLNWLRAFLSRYDPAYDLAKISGGAREAYLAAYPRVVSRMKSQDKFPVRFMGMNPLVRGRGEVAKMERSDAERKEIIDFVDAATEWGSMVLLPRDDVESVLDMADRRLVADLEAERGGVDVWRRESPVMAHEEPQRRVFRDRHVLQNENYNVRRR